MDKNKKDLLAKKFTTISNTTFLLIAILVLLFTMNLLYLTFILVAYLFFSGLYSVIFARHFVPQSQLSERMYRGAEARFMGVGYILLSIIVVYYLFK